MFVHHTYLVLVSVLVLHPVEEAAVAGDLHEVHALPLSAGVDLLVHRLLGQNNHVLLCVGAQAEQTTAVVQAKGTLRKVKTSEFSAGC